VVEFPTGTPRYVVRYRSDFGVPERFDGREWFDCPSDVDVLIGAESGAREISEAECNQLIASGKLVTLTPLEVRELEGHH
jgi:hypothetical protein